MSGIVSWLASFRITSIFCDFCFAITRRKSRKACDEECCKTSICITTNNNDTAAISQENDDLNEMRLTMQENPEMFVLNNLMMSVQFFKNFEKEIEILKNDISTGNEIFNKNCDLLSERSVVIQENLQNHIMRNVSFTSTSLNKESTTESLRPIRMFVVYDNVELSKINDSAIPMNSQTYNFGLRPTNRKGVFHLEFLNNSDKVRSKPVTRYRSVESLYSTASDSKLLSKNNRENIYGSTIIFDKNASGSSDYASNYRAENLSASNCSNLHRHGQLTDYSSVIPKECFVKLNDQILSNKMNALENGFFPKKHERFKTDKVYVNSYEFLRHFHHQIHGQLGDVLLDISDEIKEEVKRHGNVIHCTKIDYSGIFNATQMDFFEITPAFCAGNLKSACQENFNSKGSWPNSEILEKIKSFNAYVIPKGSKKSFKEIEWTLEFPSAEIYLEHCLNSAQMNLYIISLVLHKCFIRAKNSMIKGLQVQHIRNALFQMIRNNPNGWRDNRMGTSLLSLLNFIYKGISQNIPSMADFFVDDRNLFENFRLENLLYSQKQLNRILDNPLMFILLTLQSLDYDNEFYPQLDFEELFRILTVDISQCSKKPRDMKEQQQNGRNRRRNFWKEAKHNKESFELTEENRSDAPVVSDTPIIEISSRCSELNTERLGYILEFFIKHFIKMAQKCHDYSAEKQKTLYLNQAEKLCILLADNYNWRECAQLSFYEIQKLHNLVFPDQTQIQHEHISVRDETQLNSDIEIQNGKIIVSADVHYSENG